MATLEGTRASAEFMCVSLVPDVCKSPTIPVPYKILSLFDCAVKFSTNVRFRKQWVFRHNSRLSTVRCDEPGVGGGVLSGVNMGFCRPIDGTSSSTVRVNGSFVDYHVGTYMFMNCAGPEGPFNTIGQVIFLGNMLPGPVSPSGKVPKSCIFGDSGMLADLKDKFGDIEGLIEKGKKLYALAQTDWSNPSAVLGAMGGLAGIAGLQDIAKAAGTAKELYDVGNKIANTDWSDPAQALAAVAGAAGVAGMKDIAQVANLANTIRNTINTDWSDPNAALASATNLMRATGLNKMVAEMASNSILDSNIPVSQNGTTPPFFPKPGTGGNATTSGSSASTAGGTTPSQPAIPPSADGLPRTYVTPEVVDYLKESNPAAFDRYNTLSDSEKANAFIETQNPAKDSNGNDYSTNDLTAIYIPGDGFSTSQAERDGLPNVSGNLPDGLRNTLSEVFVASKDSPSVGSFFGIKEKEGNVYLLGGLVDLGSPELPGAGNTWAWWVPDRILNMDMSPYYDYHDKGYYGSNVGLSDLGKILNHEIEAFKAGATLNPLQLPLQAIYSAATTAVGVGTAVGNDLMNLGSGTFNSIGDFFGSVFGSSTADAANAAAQSFAPGGCFPTMQSTPPSPSVPGAPGSAPAAGSPAKPTTAGAPGGSASGAGSNGVLITTKAGSPAAAAAAIEAQFRKDNQTELEKAQAEEKAAQEKAEKEKAEKEKAEKEKAEKEKAEKEKAEKEKAEKEKAEKEKAEKEKAEKEKAEKEKAEKEKAEKEKAEKEKAEKEKAEVGKNSTNPSKSDEVPEMKSCPNAKPDMKNLPDGWKEYPNKYGGEDIFHCGYDGILEDKVTTPQSRQNECFYDDAGNLVDNNHQYPGCAGTPNSYDSEAQPRMHASSADPGGIYHNGHMGLEETARKYRDDATRAVSDAVDGMADYLGASEE